MQGKSEVPGQDADRERVLNGRAFLSHYAHIKVGQRKNPQCRFCLQGMDAVVTTPAQEVETTDAMDEDTGSDEERSTPYSPRDGGTKGDEGELQRETPWWRT